ncbi:MAG: hypothetical protein LCH93_28050 [Proteobacteria bacterium]|nr:hypothetical protein [Pseudomonadota bacterium]
MPRERELPAWTRRTTPENLDEIHRLLASGFGRRATAKKVQSTDPPMFPDVPVKQVEYWFRQYRDHFIVPEQKRNLLAAARDHGLRTVRRKLDLVEEMEDLALRQRARFHRGLAAEENAPLPLHAVTQLAAAYGDALERLARLYLETGLIPRMPRRVAGMVQDMMGNRAVFEFTEEEAARFAKDRLLEGVATETPEEGAP